VTDVERILDHLLDLQQLLEPLLRERRRQRALEQWRIARLRPVALAIAGRQLGPAPVSMPGPLHRSVIPGPLSAAYFSALSGVVRYRHAHHPQLSSEIADVGTDEFLTWWEQLPSRLVIPRLVPVPPDRLAGATPARSHSTSHDPPDACPTTQPP
jgi:hypothetical protein